MIYLKTTGHSAYFFRNICEPNDIFYSISGCFPTLYLILHIPRMLCLSPKQFVLELWKLMDVDIEWGCLCCGPPKYSSGLSLIPHPVISQVRTNGK